MVDSDDQAATGTVSGGLRTLLRLEGLTLLATMTPLYGVSVMPGFIPGIHVLLH